MSAETEALRVSRIKAIERFLEENAEVFGVTTTDDVGDDEGIRWPRHLEDDEDVD